MIIDLLNRRDPLRILLTLYQRGGLRFGQLQALLNVHPAQIDRALKFLLKEHWIKAYPLPGKAQIEYRIEKRGGALAEAFTAFTTALQQKKTEVGVMKVTQFQDFYLPTLSAGKEVVYGRSGNSVTIRSSPQDEKEKLAEYRAGCMMLSPKERVNRVRELSRRLILLNPHNPRSPHIAPRVRIIYAPIEQCPHRRL